MANNEKLTNTQPEELAELRASAKEFDPDDLLDTCLPTLEGYKWALNGVEETIISGGLTVEMGIASLLLKRSVASRVEKIHAELAGIDAVSMSAHKRLGDSVGRLGIWLNTIRRPWPFWKTLASILPTILSYIWLHYIRNALWRDWALALLPFVLLLNCIVLYGSFFNAWCISRIALIGAGGVTKISELQTFSKLGISAPKDPPLHLYLYWAGMLVANFAFTWAAGGEMVRLIGGSNFAPRSIAPHTEFVEPNHLWGLIIIQILWAIIALVGYRKVRSIGSDERAIALAVKIAPTSRP